MYHCANCARANASLACGQCKTSTYCSAQCQRTDWPQHSDDCEHLLKLGERPIERVIQQVTLVRVVDGDTVVVKTAQDQVKTIRLDSVDAPESKQPGGAESTRFLRALLPERLLLAGSKLDKYGRTVADVYFHCPTAPTKTVWVQEALLITGHAWRFDRYDDLAAERDRALFLTHVYETARTKRAGLWSTLPLKEPMEPSVWRHTTKEARLEEWTKTV
jgi:micrococcal nuclease